MKRGSLTTELVIPGYASGDDWYPLGDVILGDTFGVYTGLIYGRNSTYLRIGDAATTGHGLDAEDDAMFTAETEFHGPAWFDADVHMGTLDIDADSGAVTLVDMAVSDTPAAGTEESIAVAIDTTKFITAFSEADSSGGLRYKMVKIVAEATKPTAAVGYRNGLCFTNGGAGVADKLYACMKGDDDNYDWIQIAIGEAV